MGPQIGDIVVYVGGSWSARRESGQQYLVTDRSKYRGETTFHCVERGSGSDDGTWPTDWFTCKGESLQVVARPLYGTPEQIQALTKIHVELGPVIDLTESAVARPLHSAIAAMVDFSVALLLRKA